MSENPSVTEMCLHAVRNAAHQKAEDYATNQYGDDLIALALRVLVDAIDKEIEGSAE